MKEKELISPLIEKLAKDFSLQKSSLPVSLNLTGIREHLKKRISQMMGSNYERFLNSLYRIDVDEGKVHEILSGKMNRDVPGQLADLIIERQLQRIKTQILYKQGKL